MLHQRTPTTRLLPTPLVGHLALFVVMLALGGCASKSGDAMTKNVATKPAASPIRKVEATAPTEGTRQYVIEERIAERLGPDANAIVTNHIYKGQAVQVYEVKNGWARVSPYYDGGVEGMHGQIARWVPNNSLGAELPPSPAPISIPDDPRIVGLTTKPGNGLDERDVLILQTAARYFLETGIATRVVDGDKSLNKPGYYYLNFDKPTNYFFRPADIPDLNARIAALKQVE